MQRGKCTGDVQPSNRASDVQPGDRKGRPYISCRMNRLGNVDVVSRASVRDAFIGTNLRSVVRALPYPRAAARATPLLYAETSLAG